MKNLLSLLLAACMFLLLCSGAFAVGVTIPGGSDNSDEFFTADSYVSPLALGDCGIEDMDVSSVFGLWDNVCGIVDMFLPLNMVEVPELEQNGTYLYLENADGTVNMRLVYITAYEREYSENYEFFMDAVDRAGWEGSLFNVVINGCEWNVILTDWESYLYQCTDTGDIYVIVFYNDYMGIDEYRTLRDAIFCSAVPAGESQKYEERQSACRQAIETAVAGMIAQADGMIQQNDYCGAATVLDSGAQQLGGSFFESRMSELIGVWENGLVSQAEEFIANGDFRSAWNLELPYEYYLLTWWTDHGHVQAYLDLYENIEQQWTASVLSEAKDAYNNGKDYAAAIRVLQLSGLVNDAIDEAIASYQALAPVSLTSLDYIQKAKYIGVGSRISSDSLKDVNGNSYEKSSVICPLYAGGGLNSEVPKSDDDAYVTYYLGAQYSRLTGLIYRTYDSLRAKAESWTDKKIYVRIYGDDVLLYEAPAITANTYDNIPFDIDVTGVRNLKIVMQGRFKFGTDDYGLYEYVPIVAMTDLILSY